jgi:hypothetical protein
MEAVNFRLDSDSDAYEAQICPEDLEYLAELIVRGCADIAYKTSWDALVHEYGQSVIPLHLYNTIKQRYGVEE